MKNPTLRKILSGASQPVYLDGAHSGHFSAIVRDDLSSEALFTCIVLGHMTE